MKIGLYLLLSCLVLLSGYLVFGVIVRGEYKRNGRLSVLSAFLEFLVFALHANLSYAFLPARWPGIPPLPDSKVHCAVGITALAIGVIATLWSMTSLGFATALGDKTENLNRSGFYRYSRNPQIVAYSLVIIGPALLWPSFYGLAWILIYGAIAHLMVRTEEEHLSRTFGAAYDRYCDDVPRYLPIGIGA